MLLFMDGFDHYGLDTDNMLDGVYAAASRLTLGVPSWGPRTGTAVMASFAAELRKVLDSGQTHLFIGFAMGVASLPNSDFRTRPLMFKLASNDPAFAITLNATGTLSVWDYRADVNNPVQIAITQTPVIVAANWHFVEVGLDTAGGTLRIDVDGVTVMNLSGSLACTIQNISLGVNDTGVNSGRDTWFDDFTIRNAAGTRNNGFEGDLRIATLFPNSDGPNQGWTPEYLHKLGTGILSLTPYDINNPQVILCPNSTSTDLGNGDFTLETFVRFNSLPSGADLAQIFGKWDEPNNRRSYQLYLGGPSLESGNIVFRTSTDGGAGTVVEKISFPWPLGAPDLFTWYNIALCRTGGELFLFIDGNQYGLPVTDSDTYFAGPEPLGIGANVYGSSSINGHTGFDGWMDETRMTVGVGRYSANYTVTAVPYPRNVGGDPDFADVVLLMGYDSGIADESNYLRTTTPRNGASAITPDDGAAAYQVINKHTPFDSTFIEAALLPAVQTMTLGGNPSNGETATVGTYTNAGSHAAVYTFKTALASAFDVLIGATDGDTLNNLAAAINHGAGIGTLYGTGTFVNDDVFATGLPSPQMLVTALEAGSVGNAITCTDTISGGGWDGATLSGGQDIPTYSDFYFDRPPPNTTQIKAVEIMNRSYKSDAGPANVQVSFIGPLGGNLDGADNPLTLSPSYRWDIFETDPDTSAGITPSTIIGGRVRINRTE